MGRQMSGQSMHSNVKYLHPGKMYPSTFRLVRYAKMSACTYRNDPRPQKVRIPQPRTSATSDLRPKIFENFFFDFLDELGNFKHFETNFFFRQIGDLAPASGARSPKLAIRTKRRLGPSNNPRKMV